jgi:hypothetical protein
MSPSGKIVDRLRGSLRVWSEALWGLRNFRVKIAAEPELPYATRTGLI